MLLSVLWDAVCWVHLVMGGELLHVDTFAHNKIGIVTIGFTAREAAVLCCTIVPARLPDTRLLPALLTDQTSCRASAHSLRLLFHHMSTFSASVFLLRAASSSSSSRASHMFILFILSLFALRSEVCCAFDQL